ncbi:MAG: MBOAT family protein, partial [Butyrivibrio sp.]|nr:MBOAT family protein [Butyrivibrio sp.]
MSVTSFYFLCFFALVLIIYYLVPVFTKGRGQWVVLLISGIAFYVMSQNPALILYPLSSSLITWLLLKLLEKVPD